MTLSKKDRGRLTRLRARHPSLTSGDMDEDEFEKLIDDSKSVLTRDVLEVVQTGGVLSFDGTAADDLLDSYLDVRIHLAVEEIGNAGGRGKGRLSDRFHNGSVPRRVSEMRRLTDLDPDAEYSRGKMVSALNRMKNGN